MGRRDRMKWATSAAGTACLIYVLYFASPRPFGTGLERSDSKGSSFGDFVFSEIPTALNCSSLRSYYYWISNEKGSEVEGTTCSRRTFALGEGQKVISYSLYGTTPDYWDGLSDILQASSRLYPGWHVRVYTRARESRSSLCKLMADYPHFSVCDVTNLPRPLGDIGRVLPMLWRTTPIGDPQVDVFLSRDTDSTLSRREVDAVEEWLATGATLHTMRDHPMHTAYILGGMFGVRMVNSTRSRLAKLRNQMFSLGLDQNKKGLDQTILKLTLYKSLESDMVSHDSYLCKMYSKTRPFPTRRINGTFIGMPIWRRDVGRRPLERECPVECRPETHRDWALC